VVGWRWSEIGAWAKVRWWSEPIKCWGADPLVEKVGSHFRVRNRFLRLLRSNTRLRRQPAATNCSLDMSIEPLVTWVYSSLRFYRGKAQTDNCGNQWLRCDGTN
jgi:hypothetical protein